ncbi:NAD(P)-dependent oxidoreductase [Rapidithrix thailandica]|uniref:NAD(P)-dependent oxidoreductase n=1 Tax=Rapidithrix thailandica TaxID=413964 RepID=A0AAW9S4J4_9BACT
MTKVLIIDPMYHNIESLLTNIGVTPDYQPNILKEDVFNLIHQYDGLILRSKMKLDEAFLRQAGNLKFIARAGAGVDQIDESILDEIGVTLLNAPEGNRDAVGEHAMGMLLCLLNKLHTGNQEVRQKQWQREANRGWELGSKTVGIIGYGNMGKAFAKRLSGFGCRVLAYDKYKTRYGNEHAQEATLAQIQAEAEVLSFHIPLNDENRYWVDETFLDQFKHNFYLINTARGEVIPLRVLRYGLETGKLLGAGLDVLENEKLATMTEEQNQHFEYLAQQPNVLFTPHVAGWTYESYEKINRVLVQKIQDFLEK